MSLKEYKRGCVSLKIEISRQAVDVNSKEENSSLRQINLKQAGIIQKCEEGFDILVFHP
jgi:hypothetical protein